MVVFLINILFFKKQKVFLQMCSSSIKKCDTFLEVLSIKNENVRNALFH
jgi:hypothetical protein